MANNDIIEKIEGFELVYLDSIQLLMTCLTETQLEKCDATAESISITTYNERISEESVNYLAAREYIKHFRFPNKTKPYFSETYKIKNIDAYILFIKTHISELSSAARTKLDHLISNGLAETKQKIEVEPQYDYYLNYAYQLNAIRKICYTITFLWQNLHPYLGSQNRSSVETRNDTMKAQQNLIEKLNAPAELLKSSIRKENNKEIARIKSEYQKQIEGILGYNPQDVSEDITEVKKSLLKIKNSINEDKSGLLTPLNKTINTISDNINVIESVNSNIFDSYKCIVKKVVTDSQKSMRLAVGLMITSCVITVVASLVIALIF